MKLAQLFKFCPSQLESILKALSPPTYVGQVCAWDIANAKRIVGDLFYVYDPETGDFAPSLLNRANGQRVEDYLVVCDEECCDCANGLSSYEYTTDVQATLEADTGCRRPAINLGYLLSSEDTEGDPLPAGTFPVTIPLEATVTDITGQTVSYTGEFVLSDPSDYANNTALDAAVWDTIDQMLAQSTYFNDSQFYDDRFVASFFVQITKPYVGGNTVSDTETKNYNESGVSDWNGTAC